MGGSRSQRKILGSFEVLGELGQGGMGVLYLGRQPDLDRLVVLKKARREILSDPTMMDRFQREARAAAAVHHHNVVAVYDCFSARGDDYIALEFVDGVDLRLALKKLRPMDPRIAALIALEVVRGLEEIHAQGIVHRDLKPGNILMGCGGEVKIADFGIALEGSGDGLTRPGIMVGSLPYMSPEQMLGEKADHRGDLFLLGVLLYEMVTGEPPFRTAEDDSAGTLLERIQKGRYRKPQSAAGRVPGYITRLIRWCLHAKPSRRIRSASLARRYLERRVGTVSPADCRREIATYLWERGLFQESERSTRPRPVRKADSGRGLQLRWLVPIGALVLLIGIVTGFGLMQGGKSALATASAGPAVPPARMVPPASPSPVAPGHVLVVAYPWAEVRTEDGTTFLTPRAEPLEMEPGRHTITFEHPRYGHAEYVIDLESGEDRLVRHVFEEAPAP